MLHRKKDTHGNNGLALLNLTSGIVNEVVNALDIHCLEFSPHRWLRLL